MKDEEFATPPQDMSCARLYQRVRCLKIADLCIRNKRCWTYIKTLTIECGSLRNRNSGAINCKLHINLFQLSNNMWSPGLHHLKDNKVLNKVLYHSLGGLSSARYQAGIYNLALFFHAARRGDAKERDLHHNLPSLDSHTSSDIYIPNVPL